MEMEYTNSFKIYFMSEDKKHETLDPKTFTREKLEEMLAQAKGGMLEITFRKATGYIKAVCLKRYLKDTLMGA